MKLTVLSCEPRNLNSATVALAAHCKGAENSQLMQLADYTIRFLNKKKPKGKKSEIDVIRLAKNSIDLVVDGASLAKRPLAKITLNSIGSGEPVTLCSRPAREEIYIVSLHQAEKPHEEARDDYIQFMRKYS